MTLDQVYKTCFECGTQFFTLQEVLDEHALQIAAMNSSMDLEPPVEPPTTDLEFCPVCLHDWWP